MLDIARKTLKAAKYYFKENSEMIYPLPGDSVDFVFHIKFLNTCPVYLGGGLYEKFIVLYVREVWPNYTCEPGVASSLAVVFDVHLVPKKQKNCRVLWILIRRCEVETQKAFGFYC